MIDDAKDAAERAEEPDDNVDIEHDPAVAAAFAALGPVPDHADDEPDDDEG